MNAKFLLMGTTAVAITFGSLMTLAATMGQDSLYEQIITQPTEQVQNYFNIKNEVKDKYKNFIKQDKELLTQMNFPQEVSDIEIILKTNTDLDKKLLPLMKFGHWLMNSNQEIKTLSQEKYEGINSVYSNFTHNGRVINEHIMLGVNGLENKDIGIYKNLYKIFDADEQKLTSFVFFHELGHKVAHTLGHEKETVKKIIDIFEKEKNMKLTDEDKKIISTQYGESFGDSFALQMMMMKYPDLDFEKTKNLISGMRLDKGSSTHLTSPGLIDSKQLNPNANLEDIIDVAKKSSLVTTQFYSQIDFTKKGYNTENTDKRKIEISLTPLDNKAVMNNIIKSRITFSKHTSESLIKP